MDVHPRVITVHVILFLTFHTPRRILEFSLPPDITSSQLGGTTQLDQCGVPDGGDEMRVGVGGEDGRARGKDGLQGEQRRAHQWATRDVSRLHRSQP